MSREVGDRRGEGIDLGNLGRCYRAVGQINRAIEYLQQALALAREVGDRREEGTTLGNLSSCYRAVGETVRAIEHCEQALAIAREVGDRIGEGYTLSIRARLSIDEGRDLEAIRRALEAVQIGSETGHAPILSDGNAVLALARVSVGDLPGARAAAEAGRAADVPRNNHNILVLVGLIALRQGDRVGAAEAFSAAIAQVGVILDRCQQSYDAFDAKGLALAGLAVIEGAHRAADAVVAFQAARAITSAAGLVGDVTRVLAAVAPADALGVLDRVREATEDREDAETKRPCRDPISKALYETLEGRSGWFDWNAATHFGEGLKKGGQNPWGHGLIRAVDGRGRQPVWIKYAWNKFGVQRSRDDRLDHWQVTSEEAAKWFAQNLKDPPDVLIEDLSCSEKQLKHPGLPQTSTGGTFAARDQATRKAQPIGDEAAKGESSGVKVAVGEVILLIHGIRDEAEWGENIAPVLEQLAGVRVFPLKFGFFDTIAFWFPLPLRLVPILHVQRRIRHAHRLFPGAKLSVIAHSFGTYIIGTILRKNPDIVLERLILCGAVLSRGYRWDKYSHQVATEVINDCGLRDHWPVCAEALTVGYGASGTFGFGWPGVNNRFHDFGHGGFFEDGFVEKFWLPWFKDGAKKAGVAPFRRPYLWSLVTRFHILWVAFAVLLTWLSANLTAGNLGFVLGCTSSALMVALVFLVSGFLMTFTNWGAIKWVIPTLLAGGLAVGLAWNGGRPSAPVSPAARPVQLAWTLVRSERFRPSPDVQHVVQEAAEKSRTHARKVQRGDGEQMAPESPYLVFMSSLPLPAREVPPSLSLSAQIKDRARFGRCVIDDGDDNAACIIDEVTSDSLSVYPMASITGKLRVVVMILPFDQELYHRLLEGGLDGLIQAPSLGATR
jgi:tetratricopeptide (TPR) repeat protein